MATRWRHLRATVAALLTDQRGQAMTEYILVIVVVVMGLVAVTAMTKYALFNYYGSFAFWWNLPFP